MTLTTAALWLLLGDSITAGCCGSPHYVQVLAAAGAAVQREAVPGTTTYSWRPDGPLFQAVDPTGADVGVVFLGVNNAIQEWSAEYYASSLLEIVDALAVPRVCVVGPPRYHGRSLEYRGYIARIAAYQVAFEAMDVACKVDLSGMTPEHYPDDGDLHPNTLGHAFIAERIWQAVPEPDQSLGYAAAMLAVAGLRWRAARRKAKKS